MRPNEVIRGLGYSSQEAEVYLCLLKMGDGDLAGLARALHLPRTTVKAILAKLLDHGLISRFINKKRFYWSAENPDKLLTRLEEREVSLKNILPELRTMRKTTRGIPHISVYNGLKEIHRIYDDIIESKFPVVAMVPWDKWMDIFGEKYLDNFVERRRTHFLRINFLTTRNKVSEALKLKDADTLRVTRFLPKEIELDDALYIYGAKLAIITLGPMPMGIVIDEENVAGSVRLLFEAYWKNSASV